MILRGVPTHLNLVPTLFPRISASRPSESTCGSSLILDRRAAEEMLRHERLASRSGLECLRAGLSQDGQHIASHSMDLRGQVIRAPAFVPRPKARA
jgi:hypothetical protein